MYLSDPKSGLFRKRAGKTGLAMFFAVWILVILFGMWTVVAYERTSDDPAQPPPIWPLRSQLGKPRNRVLLVVVAHPYCPCTRATLRELERLKAAYPERLALAVVFVAVDARDKVVSGSLWQQAARIPDTEVVYDVGGVETALFRASLSGQTMVYDEQGRLTFTGGVTSGRGHEGFNASIEAIMETLGRRDPGIHVSRVFGCSLFDPATDIRGKESAWRKHVLPLRSAAE